MKLSIKICSAILSVLSVPLLFQANTGCGQQLFISEAEDKSFPNSYVCSCDCGTGTLERVSQVTASDDDAEQKVTDGTVDVTSPDLDMSAKQIIGVRFPNVIVPKNATIASAILQFHSSGIGANTVAFTIKGQAADSAPAFAATVNNLSMRPATTAFVNWSPPNWNNDEAGLNQLVDVKAIVQELVNRMGWAEGNALVLLVTPTMGAGARHANAQDGKPSRAAMLTITYEDAMAAGIGPQDVPVCMTEDFNPNLNGGIAPNDMLLKGDCEGRVEESMKGLAEACGYPANCTCTVQASSQKFAGKCDDECVENVVDADCSDFDPVHGKVEATNAPGDEPVCLTNSPLSYALYGRRTRCAVTGNATIEVEDESKSPGASGILQFLGTPCPGGTCAVGLEYRLDIGAITFESLFDSETFDQLAGLGKSVAGKEAMLSMVGDGMFLQDSAEVSARGNREGEQRAFKGMNEDVLNVKVKFGSAGPTCALTGSLIGSVDAELKRCEPHGPTAGKVCSSDDDCEDDDDCTDEECNCVKVSESELALALNVTGNILNQPPTANAGADQTIECTDKVGTPVVLNATASSDLDSNIRLFSWRRGSRTGPEVAIDQTSKVLQPPGGASYVLRVIDAFGQTDEATTMVSVQDTTKPEVHCAVAKRVLEILNHNLVNVGLAATAGDQCDGSLPVIVKVFGDENDEENTGDGVFSPDAKNLGVGSLRLRAERKNSGDGRVYLIVTEASDTAGNRAFDCCTVMVPKSPRLQASLQSATKQAAAAQKFCLANDGTAPSGFHVIGDGPVIGIKQ